VFHEPSTGLGRLMTVVTHPLTIARALVGVGRRS
jgi:hypothetical protein